MAGARRPVIGVMGGASVPAEVEVQAEALGRAIAERGWVLLSGGRNAGVMAASVRGARAAGGLVVGILPQRLDDGDVADGLDVAIFTGLGDARNVVNVLSSDVVVALPGREGTLSEVALALKSDRTVVLLGWDPEGLFERARATGRLRLAHRLEGTDGLVAVVEGLLEGAGTG